MSLFHGELHVLSTNYSRSEARTPDYSRLLLIHLSTRLTASHCLRKQQDDVIHARTGHTEVSLSDARCPNIYIPYLRLGT
jgi:hypothetical protein